MSRDFVAEPFVEEETEAYARPARRPTGVELMLERPRLAPLLGPWLPLRRLTRDFHCGRFADHYVIGGLCKFHKSSPDTDLERDAENERFYAMGWLRDSEYDPMGRDEVVEVRRLEPARFD